jgi:hypothetical protein
MYDAETLETLGCVEFDVSPAILDVHFDEGTGLAFLSAKGDTSIRVLETANHDPWMYILDPFMSVEPQQGVAFLLKTECDVRYRTPVFALSVMFVRREASGAIFARTQHQHAHTIPRPSETSKLPGP